MEAIFPILLLMGALLALGAVCWGGHFGYVKCLKKTQKPALSVLVGLLCALGCFLVIAGMAFGACLCVLSNMKV
jgi:hypothetical protein